MSFFNYKNGLKKRYMETEGFFYYEIHIKCARVIHFTLLPICICGGDIESINHSFLHCPEYCEVRRTPFDKVKTIDKML